MKLMGCSAVPTTRTSARFLPDQALGSDCSATSDKDK
jgi:hypothetical protein